MEYMINVDLEAPNVSGGGTDCQSAMHEELGRPFDLTVNVLGCGSANSRPVDRPPTRTGTTTTARGTPYSKSSSGFASCGCSIRTPTRGAVGAAALRPTRPSGTEGRV